MNSTYVNCILEIFSFCVCVYVGEWVWVCACVYMYICKLAHVCTGAYGSQKLISDISLITFYFIWWWGLSFVTRLFGFSLSNQLAWSILGARDLNSGHHVYRTVLYLLSHLPKPLKSSLWYHSPFIIHQIHKAWVVDVELEAGQPVSFYQLTGVFHLYQTTLGLAASQKHTQEIEKRCFPNAGQLIEG